VIDRARPANGPALGVGAGAGRPDAVTGRLGDAHRAGLTLRRMLAVGHPSKQTTGRGAGLDLAYPDLKGPRCGGGPPVHGQDGNRERSRWEFWRRCPAAQSDSGDAVKRASGRGHADCWPVDPR